MVTMGRFCVFVIIALTGCGGDTKNRCEAVADDNPCTIETCVDDTPAVDFAPADTACGSRGAARSRVARPRNSTWL